MLVEAAARFMIPISIGLLIMLIFAIIKMVGMAGIGAVRLVAKMFFGVLFGLFVALFWLVRICASGIRVLWFRITS